MRRRSPSRRSRALEVKGRPPRETWVQRGSKTAQTGGKTRVWQIPESKTSQPHSLSRLICKTSIPGSNPGGASNPKSVDSQHRSHLRLSPIPARSLIWDHLGPIRQTIDLRRPPLADVTHRRRACRCRASSRCWHDPTVLARSSREHAGRLRATNECAGIGAMSLALTPVSYTHLTLPTILRV